MIIPRSFIAGLQILKSVYAIRLFGRRIPVYCEWEVTSHCNMGCEFCSTRIDNRNSTPNIPTADAIGMIERLSEIGTKIIHFSGGEPMLREDLPELVTTAKQKGMIAIITTNGSAGVEKFEKILHADLIRISIDGMEEFHDAARKTPGAFKKAVDCLRFLGGRGARPQINAVYMPSSSYEMLASLADIAKRFNARMTVNVLNRNLNDAVSGKNCAVPSDLGSPFFKEYIAVAKKLERRYGSVITGLEPLLTVIKEGGLDVFGCRAADIAISIKYDGSISLPCNALPLRCEKGDLKKIYYGEDALRLRALQGRHPACKGCYIKCMCVASGLLKTKGLSAIISSYIRNLI